MSTTVAPAPAGAGARAAADQSPGAGATLVGGAPSGPLALRTVVVTRPEVAPGPLEQRLVARGARVLRWNALAIAPPADPAPLAAALADLANDDWVVFTSANAVAAVTARVAPPRRGERPRVAAVGSATASELGAAGWPVDLVPERFSAAGLISALASGDDLTGRRILLPASAIARDELGAGLAAAGAEVIRVDAYRTVPQPLDRGTCLASLEHGEVDVLTFASPSAVEALVSSLSTTSGEANRPPAPASATATSTETPADDHDDRALAALGRTHLVAIGPTTAAALAAHGLSVAAVAEPSTLDGLVAAAERCLRPTPYPVATTAPPSQITA